MIMEIRQLKAEFLLRNAEYRKQAEEIQNWAGRIPPGQRWTVEQLTEFAKFRRRWSVPHSNVEKLLSQPFGKNSFSMGDLGITLLSPPSAELLVLAIDLRSDIDEALAEIRRWVQTARDERKETGSWQAFRYGPEYVKELRDALSAYDLWKEGKTIAEIRDELFPEFRDVSSANDEEWRGVDQDLDPDSGTKKARRRRDLARQLIEEEKYKEILPFDAERSDLVEQFWREVGIEM